MFKNLSPGAIGIRGLSLADSISLAKQTGFAGIDFSSREAAELADAHGVQYVKDLFASASILPGQWGLPFAWLRDDQYQSGLADLPKLAALCQKLGCTRTATWVPPASDERDFAANFAWHVERFRPVAAILKDHGCRLGLEFIGPETSRASRKHEFVYTLGGMMDLARAIGTGNVGLLLDAWHLYTSGGTPDDLDTITERDIVTVHVNDAPAGVEREAQIDNVRCLPMETEVIPLRAFMRKLIALGYAGPVTPEPFSKRVNELAATDTLAAAREVAASMDKLWQGAGL